jgi:excisionase family DNA binding protein
MSTGTEVVLTAKEAARYLRVSFETIESLLESGELVGRKIGDEWRTTTRAVLSFVDGVPLQMTCCTTEDGQTVCCQPGESGCC